MKKITLLYLYSYLFLGGFGLAVTPSIALEIFMSNGDYGEIMPRIVGMFMIVLGFFIFQFVKNNDYKYYPQTIIARTFIVIFLSYLYSQTSDPFFITVNVIVLVGLLPSIYVYFVGKQNNAVKKA